MHRRRRDHAQEGVSMSNRILTIILLVSSLLAGFAVGADWTVVSESSSGDVDIFIDRHSIKHISDNVTRVWVKYRYSRPRNFDSKYIKELEVYNEYYCGGRKFKILKSEGYFTDGTQKTDPSEREGYILPDDVVYKYLCK